MVASLLLRTRVLLAAVLFVGTAGAWKDSRAQTPALVESQQADAGAVVFHQSVRRVIVDVVVSDANGKPVSGLTADDFSITEDGKPQRVRSFDVHDFDLISE